MSDMLEQFLHSRSHIYALFQLYFLFALGFRHLAFMQSKRRALKDDNTHSFCDLCKLLALMDSGYVDRGAEQGVVLVGRNRWSSSKLRKRCAARGASGPNTSDTRSEGERDERRRAIEMG